MYSLNQIHSTVHCRRITFSPSVDGMCAQVPTLTSADVSSVQLKPESANSRYLGEAASRDTCLGEAVLLLQPTVVLKGPGLTRQS
jgi:hypothetical protein